MEIGKLFVAIGADLKDFKSGLTKMKTEMKGVSGTVMKHNKAIGGGMLAVGGGIAAAGLLSVKTYADMGDEVAKMAKRTGFSTEALSELRHVAEISGTSLANLEKASRTLSGTIVDAGDGLETYTRAFERIGVDYEALAKLSPEDQFVRVMEALAGVEDETVRAATAADLLGARAGTALLPMMADGVEVFNDLRQEAHELGIVFSAEAAVKAEEMKDAVLRMERAIQGISIAIAETLMPALQPLIDIFTGITKKVRSWMDANKPLKVAIIAVSAALSMLLIPLGLMILFLPQLIALHNAHIFSLVASKMAVIASTMAHMAHVAIMVAATIAQLALTVATAAFGAVLAIVLSPITLVVLAIGALVAIGILLWRNWEKAVVFLKKGGVALLLVLGPIGMVIGGIIAVIAVIKALKNNWEKVLDFIKTITFAVFKAIMTPILAPWMALLRIIKEVAGAASHLPFVGGKFGAIRDFAAGAMDKISAITYMQHGGSGFVDSPTLFMAGEAGREAFSFTPLGAGGRMPGLEAAGGIGDVHIHTLAFVGDKTGAKKLWNLIREEARGDQRGMLGEADW